MKRGGELFEEKTEHIDSWLSSGDVSECCLITDLFLLLVFLLFQYGTLPDQVPGHYNRAGDVDRWDRKEGLFILPIIAIVLWISMTVLEKYPHRYNYLNLTEKNAEIQYQNGRLMVHTLKNEVLILFSFISFKNVKIASGASEDIGVLFMPISVGVVLVTITFFVVRMLRN
ncbi:DUF1648 domain-containing protein [Planococcus sp. CPCC 101016]|uniref:DUF1648 domain-containing protein n=1 Tax=Planococcus sp. CPCC 101016 TaxID=2599617 RepID=UPI0016469209|nr:DUF1648 domain-containing protein [Planococcus sp. CPCC 101016]